MDISPETLTLVAAILRVIALIMLYILIGFGPGYIVGVILAGKIFGRGQPLRMEKHQEAIQQAVEHNKQWHPDDPRWKK